MSARPGARFAGAYPAADPYDQVPVTTAAESAAAFDAAFHPYRPPSAGRHAGPGGANLAPVMAPAMAPAMVPPPDRVAGPAPYPDRTPDQAPYPDREPAEAPAPADGELGGDLAPTLHSGRAARRRQVARWKKSRRRAGVATAVALFGGGVTVASMEGLSGRGGATASASHYDTVTPVSLRTADGGTYTPDGGTGGPGGAPATGTTGHQHDGSTAPARTGGQATHPGTDSGGTTPITSGTGTGTPASYQQVRPAVVQQPAGAGTSGTQDGGSGGTGGTGGGTPATTGGGSTTASDTGSGAGSGSTTATGSDSGTQTGSGSGTTTTTGTSTPPTTTGTSPTDTPPQHGLCLLVLCID